jgi:hypothetical protein
VSQASYLQFGLHILAPNRPHIGTAIH